MAIVERNRRRILLARLHRRVDRNSGDALSASRKIALAEKIGSRALRADAMEAVTCGWLSLVVVVSLAAQWLFGAWWIDSVGSLAIVWFLVKEAAQPGPTGAVDGFSPVVRSTAQAKDQTSRIHVDISIGREIVASHR